MLISILLPTRNRPERLARAVASVLAQTHEDWQLVLLDNSDEPVTIPADPRIDYLWLRPQPVARLYNKALALADGEVVCHFADDDLLPPWALETAAANIGDAEWLVGGTEIRTEDGRLIAVRGGSSDALARTLAGEYWLGGAVYWRKTLSERVGGYSDEYDGAADFDLFLRFAHAAQPVIIPDVLYWYTDWPGTDSRVRAANQAVQSARIASTIGG